MSATSARLLHRALSPFLLFGPAHRYAEQDDAESFARVGAGRDCAVWWKYFEEWGGMRYNDDKGATMLGGATPWAEGMDMVFHMD
jgi:hypothetical protein